MKYNDENWVSFLVLIIVALNAYAVGTHAHGEILGFGSYSLILHLTVITLFFTVIWICVKNPRKIIDIILYLSVLTSGMYLYRFAIFDEIIISAALIGALLAKKVKEHKKYNNLIYILIIDIMVMSVVGLINFGEIRALRYIYISGLLLVVLYLQQEYKLQEAGEAGFNQLMLKATLFYSAAYLINSVIIELFRSQETILGIGGAGAGYQGVIFLFTMPSCFELLKNGKNIRIKIFAMIAILSASIIALVADSRYVMMTLLIAFVFSLKKFEIKHVVIVLVSVISMMSIIGFTFTGNGFIWLTLITDVFSQDFGQSHIVDYYGTTAETASGDQGRALLFLNGFYYYLENIQFIITGIGSYGYVHKAYDSYWLLLKEIGLNDTNVNVSAFGTLPRPPSISSYIVDYGLLFWFLLVLLFANFIKKAIKVYHFRPELMSYIINLVLFMAIGEQLDVIATYLLLSPIMYKYFFQNCKHLKNGI